LGVKNSIFFRFGLTCRIINYFRYLLRFISAYIIVAFTIQRAAVIHSPLKDKFKSKKSAWKTVASIAIVGIISNFWVPFLFKIQTQSHGNKQYCDIKKEYSKEYFQITIIYISLIMLIPIVAIFVGNSIIIFSIIKANLERKRTFRNLSISFVETSNHSELKRNRAENRSFKNNTSIQSNRSELKNNRAETRSLKNNASIDSSQIELKNNRAETRSLKTNASTKSRKDSRKITKMMIFISLSYAILNLPYFITWCLFFYGMAFKKITSISKNYMFATIQISEIFYILNYGIHFYIYSASGQAFRKNVISMFKC
jgi:hypothetical protein